MLRRFVVPVGLALSALALSVSFPIAGASGAGDLRLAVEPGYVVAQPGGALTVNFSVYNAGTRSLTLELGAHPLNSTRVNVTLSSTRLTLAAGEAARVPATVRVPSPFPVGPQAILFGAKEVALATSTGASPLSNTTTFDLRIGPATGGKNLTELAARTPKQQPQQAQQDGGSAAGGSQLALLVAGGAAGAALAAGAIIMLRKRWPALAAAALPLYTRLAGPRVLESATRRRIADAVLAEPGVTFGELQRKLALGAGTLTHHARVLERAGVIFSSPDGQTRRFFHVGQGRVDAVPPLRERAVEMLSQSGGALTASELAQRLGVSKQALHYHVKRLASEGRILVRDDGRLALAASVTIQKG